MRRVRIRTAFGDGLKGSPSVAERKLAPVTWSFLTNNWRLGLLAEQQIIPLDEPNFLPGVWKPFSHVP